MKKIISLLGIFCLIIATGFAQNDVSKPIVQKPVYFDVSPPLRDMVKYAPTKADNSWKDGEVRNHIYPYGLPSEEQKNATVNDPNLQRWFGRALSDTTIQNFDGNTNTQGFYPPDTYGDVGPDHYFQVVNCHYSIYNKTGTKLLGPANNSSVWNGMPNNSNDGDAVVVYDEVANRWIFSQFSLPFSNGPFFQMIAISQTPDPTGSWYRYQYSFSNMGDYPKFGVWPDGYYMTVNRFSASPGTYQGIAAVAFDRTKMLAGDPSAQMVEFTLPSSNEAWAMLPSDCDGAFPPMGTPNYIAYQANNHIRIYEFHVDWANTTNSTFTNSLTLPVNPYNGSVNGIQQLGTTLKLDPISGRIMYRLGFRKFSDHWSMAASGTVNVGSNVAGVRWYELRNVNLAGWTIYQQGTYSPDNNSRWMGCIAMDTAGNMALGYSISSSTMYPSIRYTGRLASDPLNTMTLAEKTIFNGQSYESYTGTGNLRWGDYSSMTTDPSAPGTFWYTQLYYLAPGVGWQTRIASFSIGNVFASYATTDPAVICAGADSVQLSCVAYGGSGTYTYSWSSIPAGFASTLQNPKSAPAVDTKYVVIASDGSQSRNDTTLTVTVMPQVTTFAGNDTVVQPSVITINLQGTASGARVTQWQTTGNGTFGNVSQLNTTYTFGTTDKTTGSVDLKLIGIATPPCTGSFTSKKNVQLNPLGISDNNISNLTLAVHPNPARDNVSIIINGLENTVATLTLMNVKGQSVYSSDIEPTSSSITKQIDLSSFAKGVYIIRLKTDRSMVTKQLIIQ